MDKITLNLPLTVEDILDFYTVILEEESYIEDMVQWDIIDNYIENNPQFLEEYEEDIFKSKDPDKMLSEAIDCFMLDN